MTFGYEFCATVENSIEAQVHTLLPATSITVSHARVAAQTICQSAASDPEGLCPCKRFE